MFTSEGCTAVNHQHNKLIYYDIISKIKLILILKTMMMTKMMMKMMKKKYVHWISLVAIKSAMR